MRAALSSRHGARALSLALLVLVGARAALATDSFNPNNYELTAPSVVVGSATFSNIVVGITSVADGPSGSGPNGSEDSYNTVNQELTIPAVTVANRTVYNVVAVVSGLVTPGSVSGADSYDGTDLTAPNVLVGNTMYTDVVIAVTPGNIVHVASGMPTATNDSFDAQTGRLSIPAVQAGGRAYTNVTLAISLADVKSVGGHYDAACRASGQTKDANGCWDVNILTGQSGVAVFPETATATGLACPPGGGTFTCLLVGDGAQYAVLKNGTWSTPVAVLTAPGSTVGPPSCVSSSFCMAGAVTNVGDPNVAGAWLVFDGMSWTTVAAGTTDKDGPETGNWACGSSSFCWAVITTQATSPSNLSYELKTETFNGSWSGYALYGKPYEPGLGSLSCVPGSTTCIAVGGGGASNGPAAIMTVGGSLTMLTPTGPSGFGSVSCVSGTFCMVTDGAGHSLIYNPAADSWSAPQLIIPSGLYASHSATAVSCASENFCVAIDSSDYIAITYVNGAWGTPDYLLGAPGLVSCPTNQNCYAAVGTGNGLVVETYTRTTN